MQKPFITKPLIRGLLFSLAFIFFINHSYSQSSLDSIFNKLDPQKWFATIEKKLDKLEGKIISKSEKTLQRLQRQEEKIYRRLLSTKDSPDSYRDDVKAKLAEIQNKYKAQADKLKNPVANLSSGSKQYIPYLDTLKTALKFLDKNELTGGIKDALDKLNGFEGRLQQAEELKKFIRERKEQLKNQLEQLGLLKQLKHFNKEVYYYAAQIKEYKAILNDPKKMERKALDLLCNTKEFKEFFRKNSMLASLFRMPGDGLSHFGGAGGGLQTRAQVNNLIQQQIAAGGPNAMTQMQQNLQGAQSQLQQLKDKVLISGGSSSDDVWDDSPPFGKGKGWAPNNQKTKSFLQRLELGTNIQSQKPNGYFPVTTDIGLSLGYKPNDKSIIGIGASYKLGWGQNLKNIKFSNQGVGLRSFVDWKIKGSFWFSGGYEMNYRSAFNSINQLKEMNAWQQSGLIGLSKSVLVRNKFFKKTKLQLLWDFLSYDQRPRTQPVVFRIEYTTK